MPKETESETLDREPITTEDGQDLSNDASENDSGGEEEPALTVQIGDDAPDQQDEERAPQWVRDLRRETREKDRRIKELESKLAPEKPDLGEKPTLAGCDYDNGEYETKLAEWFEAKREADAAEVKTKLARERQEERWQGRLSAYNEGKAKLGVKDFDEAEDMARDALSSGFNGIAAEDIRINIIKQGARDPTLVMYALGKNAKRAKELGAIEDPVEFAMAVGRLEGEMKVSRKATTEPERTGVEGAGTGAGSNDSHLDRLRAEAAKTGDYTKVTAYKKKLRA